MPFDLNAFLQTAIPAGIGAAGAIAGKKAQSAGNANSRAAIEDAYKQALSAYNQAHGRTTDINNWMLQSSFAPINFGYQQGRSDLQNALLMGQQGLAGGQSQIADILSPYTSAGKKGAAETNFLLYGQRPGAAPVTPGAPASPPPTTGGFNLPPNFSGGFNIPPPPSGPGSGAGAGGAFNALTGYAPTSQVKGSIAPTIGNIVGMATGGIAAPLIGNLVGHLTRGGREKTAASGEANHFSDWFWKDVKPQYDAGNIDLPTLQAAAQTGFDTYRNWLGDTMKDKNVANNSATSQLGYLNQGLQPLGFTVK